MVIPLGNQATAKEQCIGAQLLSRANGMSRIAGHQVERCGMAECHAVQLEWFQGNLSSNGSRRTKVTLMHSSTAAPSASSRARASRALSIGTLHPRHRLDGGAAIVG